MNVSQINIITKLRSRHLKASLTSEENGTQRGRQMCYTSNPVLVWMKTASTAGIYSWILRPQLVEPFGKDWVVWPCWRRYMLLRVSFEISRARVRRSLSVSVSLSLVSLSSLCLPATMPPVIMIYVFILIHHPNLVLSEIFAPGRPYFSWAFVPCEWKVTVLQVEEH